jgi:hypothetical protein
MADFVPVNRYILIQPPLAPEEPQGNQLGILLPDDYAPVLSAHASVKILDWADDVKLNLSDYGTAIVQRSMIEEIDHSGEVLHVILENYVFGLISDEE